MAENVLKEFLVKLGWKVDDKSEKQFQGAIRSATLQAEILGRVIERVAYRVTESVKRMVTDFDQLYWQAGRAQSTVSSLKEIGYAVSQLGGSYQSAVSSIEAFGTKIRQNPGYESLVRQLGVVTRHNGKLRDTAEILQDVAKALKSKPYYVAYQYANALGMDEATFRALQSGELTKYLEEYRRKAAAMGVDQNAAAKSGNEFMSALRSLNASLGLVGEKLAIEILPSITEFVKQVDQFLQKNADSIVEVFKKLGDALAFVGEMFGKLLTALAPLWDGFDTLAKSMTGQDGVNAAFVALAAIIGGSVLVKLARLVGMVARLRLGWLALIAVIGSDLMKTPEQRAKEMDDSLNNPSSGPQSWFSGTWLGKKIDQGMQSARNALGIGGDPSGGIASGGAPKNKAEAAKESYRFWRSKGLSHEQALGVVANEQEESAYNPRARGDGGNAHGLYQWHGDRRRKILAGTGIDVSTADANQQREAAHWESTQGTHDPKAMRAWRELKQAKTPGEAAAIWSRLWERPAAVAEAQINRARIANGLANQIKPEVYEGSGSLTRNGYAIPRFGPQSSNNGQDFKLMSPKFSVPPLTNTASGGADVSMSQKTEINIIGSGDPTATANAVADRQGQVNSGMTRNLQGAIR